MTELCVSVLPCGKAVLGIRRAVPGFWWSWERLVSPFLFLFFIFIYVFTCDVEVLLNSSIGDWFHTTV